MAAYRLQAFATTRLQKLTPPFTGRLGKGASLTPRELCVLRSLSLGHRVAEIGKDLGLGRGDGAQPRQEGPDQARCSQHRSGGRSSHAATADSLSREGEFKSSPPFHLEK